MSIKRKKLSSTSVFSGFLLHLHPRTIPEETIRFTLSWGLGGISLTLVILLFLTGLFQLISYQPGIENAYNSVLYMYTDGSLGGFLRNIHYWSGNLLIITTFLHFLRVFYTGAYGEGRRMNWLVGIGLLATVCFVNFTGYLLPWDQLAFWAVTIFTNMLGYVPFFGSSLMALIKGGDTISQVTLSNFFVFHIAVLPFILVVLLIYHFWFIRKARGLIQQKTTQKPKRVEANTHLVGKEIGVACLLLALMCLFSVFVNAPLEDPANPAMSPNPAKGAWYFMGLQELLLHFHPLFAITIIPLAVTCFLLGLLGHNKLVLPGGVWFGGSKGWQSFSIYFLSAVFVTTSMVIVDDLLLRENSLTASSELYTRGWVPFLAIILSLTAAGLVVYRKSEKSYAETVKFLFTTFLGGLLTLTVIGIWFRGVGMQLIVPWS